MNTYEQTVVVRYEECERYEQNGIDREIDGYELTVRNSLINRYEQTIIDKCD